MMSARGDGAGTATKSLKLMAGPSTENAREWHRSRPPALPAASRRVILPHRRMAAASRHMPLAAEMPPRSVVVLDQYRQDMLKFTMDRSGCRVSARNSGHYFLMMAPMRRDFGDRCA